MTLSNQQVSPFQNNVKPLYTFRANVLFASVFFAAAPMKDVAKINEGKQPLYQDDTNKRVTNALDLLNGLDEDAVEAKRLQHPQAEMIEQE